MLVRGLQSIIIVVPVAEVCEPFAWEVRCRQRHAQAWGCQRRAGSKSDCCQRPALLGGLHTHEGGMSPERSGPKTLTLYALTGRIHPVLPKFQLKNFVHKGLKDRLRIGTIEEKEKWNMLLVAELKECVPKNLFPSNFKLPLLKWMKSQECYNFKFS